MKILVLSDVHSRIESLKKLLENKKSSEIDLVVIAGDLTNFGGETQIKEVIDEIKKLNKKIFAIPGNLDTKEGLEFMEKKGFHCIQEKKNLKIICLLVLAEQLKALEK